MSSLAKLRKVVAQEFAARLGRYADVPTPVFRDESQAGMSSELKEGRAGTTSPLEILI